MDLSGTKLSLDWPFTGNHSSLSQLYLLVTECSESYTGRKRETG